MRNGVRLGRIAGIDVIMDWSLLIIFFLITFSLGAGLFPSWHPQWGPGLVWGTAAAAAVLFLASVFVHELSHAVVGRAQGMEINRITLFVFGGMAHLEHEPQTWRVELWMAIVGPITSLVLGVAFIFLGGLMAGPIELDPNNPQQAFAQLGPVPTLLFWLGPINIILGLFNLVPGFPLDGGRVLRAILWGVTGNLRRATRWASQLGQFFAWMLIASGVLMVFGYRLPVFGSGPIGGIWLMFIGWFLHNAALTSYRQLLVRESLADVPVARVMQTRFDTVPPDLTIDALIDERLMHSDQRAFPVIEDDRFLGLICLEDVRRVEREARARTTAREVMTPVSALTCVGPNEDAAEALFTLSRKNVNQLPVVEDQRLRGLLRREDVLKWLSLYGEEKRPGVHKVSDLGS